MKLGLHKKALERSIAFGYLGAYLSLLLLLYLHFKLPLPPGAKVNLFLHWSLLVQNNLLLLTKIRAFLLYQTRTHIRDKIYIRLAVNLLRLELIYPNRTRKKLHLFFSLTWKSKPSMFYVVGIRFRDFFCGREECYQEVANLVTANFPYELAAFSFVGWR